MTRKCSISQIRWKHLERLIYFSAQSTAVFEAPLLQPSGSEPCPRFMGRWESGVGLSLHEVECTCVADSTKCNHSFSHILQSLWVI